MLYEINHDRRSTLWCGPAAIAAVTGKPTSEIHAKISEVGGRQNIKGVYNRELLNTLQALGAPAEEVWSLRWSTHSKPPTLAAWLRENRSLYADRPVIVQVTRHYVTVFGKRLIDNTTGGTVALGSAPHRRARVKRAWAVFQ
jgi:hypothetical protein